MKNDRHVLFRRTLFTSNAASYCISRTISGNEAMNTLSPHPGAGTTVRDDIAIVGYSFKLPQDVDDDQSFWEVLEKRRNLRTAWPPSRADPASFMSNKSRKVC